MTRRDALLQMIRSIEGGMSKAADHLGYTRDALSNRIYERKGQQLPYDDILELQILSGRALYAEAFSLESGGVFVKLPEVDAGNEELLAKFQQLYAFLGELSKAHYETTKDGLVDKREKKLLEGLTDKIQRTLIELMAITYRVYCPQGAK